MNMSQYCYDNGVDRSDLRNNVTFKGLSLGPSMKKVQDCRCKRKRRRKEAVTLLPF